MRCPICNSEDDGIAIDPRTHKFGDCYTCEEVIFDTVQGYPPVGGQDEVVVVEDD